MSTVLSICCLVVVAILGGINGLPEQQAGMEDHSKMMKISVSAPRCACEYQRTIPFRGCFISKAAPPNAACKCTLHSLSHLVPAFTCEGSVVACKDETSEFCKNPDTSYESCIQGQGNCDGIRGPVFSECNCEWRFNDMVDGRLSEGCVITEPAFPPGNACRCKIESMHIYPPQCSGYIVECKNEKSPYCEHPDTSYMSCRQGQGNCDGYPIWPEPEKERCLSQFPRIWIEAGTQISNPYGVENVTCGVCRSSLVFSSVGGLCCQPTIEDRCSALSRSGFSIVAGILFAPTCSQCGATTAPSECCGYSCCYLNPGRND